MLLADLVSTADVVAATGSRRAKIAALAELLAKLAPGEVAMAVGFLAGDPRQGRVGIGWAAVSAVEAAPATVASLTLGDVDQAFEDTVAAVGPGSVERREQILRHLLERATDVEAAFIRRLLLGSLRQGALAGVMAEAVARAAGVPAALFRRAVMLSGDLRAAATVALGGAERGLLQLEVELFRPLKPMLAASAKSLAEALGEASAPVLVEWKLDGIRIQVHRHGDDVRIFTRNLNDITLRVPEVVDIVRQLPAERLILDGEALTLDAADRPRMFQDTMSRLGRQPDEAASMTVPWFFDCVHHDGVVLLDRPLAERREVLQKTVGRWSIPSLVTADLVLAEEFLAGAIAAGHEGVLVKSLAAPYAAGRRGRAWIKVKPAHTLDLVVLAAEWGHGRRQGWLSNLHLGARDPGRGAFVMVGKTFKGLTDALLRFQTERLKTLETASHGITVRVRPELVVEIELDGVQKSTRYPGGVALRFARVKRYRDDKSADEADTIDTVRALLAPGSQPTG